MSLILSLGEDQKMEPPLKARILEIARTLDQPFRRDTIVSHLSLSNNGGGNPSEEAVKKQLQRLSKASKEHPVPPLKSLGKGLYQYNGEEIEAVEAAEANRRVQIRARFRQSFAETGEGTVNMDFPMNLQKHFRLYPGSLVVVAGTTNSGKTTFALETLTRNLESPSFTGLTYFNSEMSQDELLDRIQAFEAEYQLEPGTLKEKVDWLSPECMDALNDRAMKDLSDAIDPGHLTIIDYLEIDDDFYKIGGVLSRLQGKVKKGVLVVLLQKTPRKEYAFGGISTLTKARLGLCLDWNHAAGVGTLHFSKVKTPTADCPPQSKLYAFNPTNTRLVEAQPPQKGRRNDPQPRGKSNPHFRP